MKIVQIKPGFWREDDKLFRRYMIWIHLDTSIYHTRAKSGPVVSDWYIYDGVCKKQIAVIMEDKDE